MANVLGLYRVGSTCGATNKLSFKSCRNFVQFEMKSETYRHKSMEQVNKEWIITAKVKVLRRKRVQQEQVQHSRLITLLILCNVRESTVYNVSDHLNWLQGIRKEENLNLLKELNFIWLLCLLTETETHTWSKCSMRRRLKVGRPACLWTRNWQ